MDAQFYQNADKGRFEYQTQGETAIANYRQRDGVLYIDYVEAPPALRGTGAAGQLMQHIVDHATQQNLKIVPICGYAASWLKRHEQKSS